MELLNGEKSAQVKRPEGFTLPSAPDLAKVIAEQIKKCKALFAQPTVTDLTWNRP